MSLLEVRVPLERLAACMDEGAREDLVIEVMEAAGADWRRIAGTPHSDGSDLVYRVPALNPWLPPGAS